MNGQIEMYRDDFVIVKEGELGFELDSVVKDPDQSASWLKDGNDLCLVNKIIDPVNKILTSVRSGHLVGQVSGTHFPMLTS